MSTITITEQQLKDLNNGKSITIEPPKKKHVIEYNSTVFCITQIDEDVFKRCKEDDYSYDALIGKYRKTEQNAKYSQKRNKRANRLEALVEDIQGELHRGVMCIYFEVEEKKWLYDNGGFGRVAPESVCMEEDTAIKVCELLNNGQYSLDGEL